jgi:hypothetical protein
MKLLSILPILFLSVSCCKHNNVTSPDIPEIPTSHTAVSVINETPAAQKNNCWPFTNFKIYVEVEKERLVTFRYEIEGGSDIKAVLLIQWSRWMPPKKYPLTERPVEGSFRHRYSEPGNKYIQYWLEARGIPDSGCSGRKAVVVGVANNPFQPRNPPPAGCTSCSQASPQLSLLNHSNREALWEYSAKCGYVFLHTGRINQSIVGPLPLSGTTTVYYPVGFDMKGRLAVVLDNGKTCYSSRVSATK